MINANRLSFLLALGSAALTFLWVLFSKVLVPPIIASAYAGKSLGIINSIISGQAIFAVDHYLNEWDKISGQVSLVLLIAGLLLLIVNRPEVQRTATPCRIKFVWIIVVLLMLGFALWNVRNEGQIIIQGEYLWIGRNMADGHGFSLDLPWCLLREACISGGYFATALVEPVYPVWIGIWLRASGDYGQLVIVVFQMIALFLTAVVMYYVGLRIFNFQTGILAGSILAVWGLPRPLAEDYLGPAILGGLMVSISAYMIVCCLEELSVRKGIVLGLVLGFSSLTLASTSVFVPLAVLLVLASGRECRPVAWKTAVAILLAAGAVISPWTIRNFVVFGQLVPVRTGFGLNVYLGNPVLAATYSAESHACSDTLGPLWSAQNAGDAILLLRKSREKRHIFYKRGFDCIEEQAPHGYESFNEAERDKVFLKKTLEFVVSEPETFAKATYHKVLLFFYRGWDRETRVVSILALVGALMTLRIAHARMLTLLALGYALPYVLAMHMDYRYRYPIEPILLLLASYVVTLGAKQSNNVICKLVRWTEGVERQVVTTEGGKDPSW